MGHRLLEELKAAIGLMLYFAAWLGVLILLKTLVLEEYQIRFHEFSMALMEALILSKVVLLLQHVSLGAWVRQRPALVDLVLRTLLYGAGVFVVLLLEKSFEARHEQGGFILSLARVFQHPDIPHVLANTLALGGALFWFNVVNLVRRRWGDQELARVFLSPPPPGAEPR